MLTLRNLCAAILLSLSFTKSLTIDFGFALKPYELLIPIALLAAFKEGSLDFGTNGRFLRAWLVFLFLSLFPSAWGYLLVLESDISTLEWASGRFAPLANVAFHTSYLTLDIVALAVFLVALSRQSVTRRDFARWWTIGALLAVGHTLLLNAVFFAGLPNALALRWSPVQTASVAGIEFVRSGPFEEGNYLGLYLLISLILAVWAGSRFRDKLYHRAIPFLVIGIFLSASPAALGLMLLMLILSLLDRAMPTPIKIMQVGLIASIVGVVLSTDLLQELVINKFSLLLFGGVTDAGNVSLVRRINEMYHAWEVFRSHPLGVGIGNFGYFWGDHPELYPWLQVAYTTKKQIPNMVYLEVLTEQGIQGLLVFLWSMSTIAAPLWRSRQSMLLLGLSTMLVYFLVFPTFRLMFLWVFWAFLLSAGTESAEQRMENSLD